MTPELITAWGTVLTAIATIGLVIVAWVQLSGIKQGLNMSSLTAVLQIETQMNERKVKLDDCVAELRRGELDKLPKEALEILIDLYKSAKENYFNALDRLCYCIEHNYVSDKDWRAEYRNLIKGCIDTHPKDFDEASAFRNIKKINAKWQSE